MDGCRGLAAEPRSRAVRGRVPRQRNRRGGSAEPNGRRLEGSRRRDCRSSTQVIVGDRALSASPAASPPVAKAVAPTEPNSDRCSRRTPAIDCHVRRPRRLDGVVGAARSRGHARDRRCISPIAAPISSRRPAVSSPNTWATGCWPISVIRRPMSMTPNARCRRALRWSRRSPKLNTAAGVPLQVRVGIATGLVVVGDLIGAGAAQEQAVVGETPNLAARLQALAEPNTVVIAEGTRKLLGDLFELGDLGPRTSKASPGRCGLGRRCARVPWRAALTPFIRPD